MPIAISPDAASSTLSRAVQLAKDPDALGLPAVWIEHSRRTHEMSAKTYVPALGTALLARATDARIDPLAIKHTQAVDSYSARNLCHGVLVPEAREHGFSIRTTGNEPLNNQPFFRYLHMTHIDRVRNVEEFGQFIDRVRQIADLSREEAERALAAFVKVGFEVAENAESYVVSADGHTFTSVASSLEEFLTPGVAQRPERLQAFAAACMDLVFDDVRTRRINDPSRDLPGDVHAFEGAEPLLAMEVRGKRVKRSALHSFFENCAREGLQRAVLFVDAPGHLRLEQEEYSNFGPMNEGSPLLVSVFQEWFTLFRESVSWSDATLQNAVHTFVERMTVRLIEIEASAQTMDHWVSLLRDAVE